MNNPAGAEPPEGRLSVSLDELGISRRKAIRNGIFRFLVLAALLYQVLGEAGPWTAATLGMIYLAFELYELQARRQIARVDPALEILKAAATSLRDAPGFREPPGGRSN